jgi:beta-xylosidase
MKNVNLRTIICLVVVSLPITLPSYSNAQIASGEIKQSKNKSLWVADNGNGTYTNPIVFADYSDPDVIRVREDFYMVSSSFNCTPVMPVLHSKDLVNWAIIGHVSENLPSAEYRQPQHGKGCWAPSIRFHAGEFYVYYGDPDLGIYMSKAKNPSGPWEPLLLVRQAKGWIDPCPLWDDDGNVYLVHAWAKSRVGFNSVLTVHRMSTDGKQILDDGVMVFDGHKNHPTIEGPKIYRRNAYYYIFAPAGGVANGWQTVLRAKHVFGPYEDKIVLDQGTTAINGPHQGGWIETQTGESWFVHFQEHGAYGRIVHLQPMTWNDDWPTIGVDPDGDGKGEPVLTWKKPQVGKVYSITCPQTSDEFDSTALGLQWQWHANHSHQWYSLTEKKGALRLKSIVIPDSNVNLWSVPNLLLQKFPAPEFMATTQVILSPANVGEKAGLIIMGLDYSYISIVKKTDSVHLTKVVCKDADKGTGETEEADVLFMRDSVMLRVVIDTEAVCRFSYSEDGSAFKPLGKEFVAREGKWIGAKVGIFSSRPFESISNGYSDFDWFRIND